MNQGDDSLTGRDDLPDFGRYGSNDAVGIGRELCIRQLIFLSLLSGQGLVILGRSLVVGRLVLVQDGRTDGIHIV